MSQHSGVPSTLIDNTVVDAISAMIRRVYPEFDASRFRRRACEGLEALALKARSKQIADALQQQLPPDCAQALEIVSTALGPPPADTGVYGQDGLTIMPLLDWAEHHGRAQPALTIAALGHMTQHFSAEFAIRPYLVAHRDLVWPFLQQWASDPDWRRRRLVSEGTRPRLPWASRLRDLQADPRDAIALLDTLHNDPHLIVRRSVANHLNDITKDHPDLAADTALRWHNTGASGSAWTVRHGLRSLIKAGHPVALHTLGFIGGEHVQAHVSLDKTRARIGQSLTLSLSLAQAPDAPAQRLAIDYELERPLHNGKTGRKIFKLCVTTLAAGQTQQVEKRIHFTQRSTRTYYPGVYALHVLINGRRASSTQWQLDP